MEESTPFFLAELPPELVYTILQIVSKSYGRTFESTEVGRLQATTLPLSLVDTKTRDQMEVVRSWGGFDVADTGKRIATRARIAAEKILKATEAYSVEQFKKYSGVGVPFISLEIVSMAIKDLSYAISIANYVTNKADWPLDFQFDSKMIVEREVKDRDRMALAMSGYDPKFELRADSEYIKIISGVAIRREDVMKRRMVAIDSMIDTYNAAIIILCRNYTMFEINPLPYYVRDPEIAQRFELLPYVFGRRYKLQMPIPPAVKFIDQKSGWPVRYLPDDGTVREINVGHSWSSGRTFVRAPEPTFV